MNQFFFDALVILGGILLAVWGVFFSIEKLHKSSWYFFFAAIICFVVAGAISYFKYSSNPPEKSLIKIEGFKLDPPIGDSLQVQVCFMYTGDSDAKISTHTWFWFDESPNVKDFEKPNDIDFGILNMSNGEERILIIGKSDIGAQKIYKQLISRELYLYVIGTLECHDNFDKVYKKEFCNIYEPRTQYFADVIGSKILSPQNIHPENEPYIYFITKVTTVEFGKLISCRLDFENIGGNSPEVVIHCKLFWCTDPKTEFTLDNNSKKIINNFSSGESKFIADTFKSKATKEIIDAIKSGSIYIYFYGRFEYTDKFNKRYEKDFCFVYDKVSKFVNVPLYRLIYDQTQTNK